MNRLSRRAKSALALAVLLVAGLVFFLGEFLLKSREWIVFSGSPHVYTGNNLDCGTVTDRNGTILLDSTGRKTYHEDATIRAATIHILGDRYGYISAPALSQYGDAMVGFDLLNGVYTTKGIGGSAMLTISAKAQAAAVDALDGRKGVVAVYNYKTGEILCAVSSPNYDPDNEPDFAADETGTYDGVYLNRLTQVSYVPGSIFKIVTAAAAFYEIDDIGSRTFYCDGSLWLDGEEVTCSGVHGTVTLRQALMHSCNCAFGELAAELGAETMSKYVNQFLLTESVSFDGITTAEGHYDVDGAADAHVAWSGIGQHTNLINPCRYLLFMGQIANGGTAAEPYLVQSVTSGNSETYSAQTTMSSRVMRTAVAAELKEMLHYCVVNAYGESSFPDLYVCGKSGTAQVGAGLEPHATFAGFCVDDDYPLAFVVIIENGGSGSRQCVPILSEVLPACMEAMDET